MHKIKYSPEKNNQKKYVCLPYLKFSACYPKYTGLIDTCWSKIFHSTILDPVPLSHPKVKDLEFLC